MSTTIPWFSLWRYQEGATHKQTSALTSLQKQLSLDQILISFYEVSPLRNRTNWHKSTFHCANSTSLDWEMHVFSIGMLSNTECKSGYRRGVHCDRTKSLNLKAWWWAVVFLHYITAVPDKSTKQTCPAAALGEICVKSADSSSTQLLWGGPGSMYVHWCPVVWNGTVFHNLSSPHHFNIHYIIWHNYGKIQENITSNSTRR